MDYQYDSSRKLSSTGRISSQNSDTPSAKDFMYNPTPWNFKFRLQIMVKNAEDGTSIVEQILPYFSPEFTATLDLVPSMGISYDIPIILNSVGQTDSYEGSYDTRRTIIWTLDFTLKGWLFRQINIGGNVVTRFEGNLRQTSGNVCVATPNTAPTSTEIVVLPGLTANGMPTTDITQTIDRDLISSDDDYDFIHDFTEG